MNARLFTFVGGVDGPWRVVDAKTIAGDPVSAVDRLAVVAGAVVDTPPGAKWLLRGVTSNERYVARAEKEQLVGKQPAIGRTEASCAALIPIRKTPAWWSLTQDERRRIFEETSHHIQTGLKYLPAVARRLHHCRDLGADEPFDFLTWFEYAPADGARFDQLLQELRSTAEWTYVDREVDIRVVHDPS